MIKLVHAVLPRLFVQTNVMPAHVQIVSMAAIHHFLKSVQSKDVTVHWVENGFHELFLGPHQQEARTAAFQWLQAHI